MAEIVNQHSFGGLDTRSNKLMRKDGTSSDNRNVYLDSNKNLIKRPDLESLNVPRAAEGVTGEFLDILPFDAVIIDVMNYEDYLVVAVEFLEGTAYVNKFYTFDPETGVLTFIPFEKETFNSSIHGQIVNKGTSDISGRFTKTNQENVLFFMGTYCKDDTGSPFLAPTAEFDRDNNLSAAFTYDGKVIGRSGCPAILKDTVKDVGPAGVDQYVRLLPIKIDALGRHTFGNYSTHNSTNDGFSVGNQDLIINASDPAILDTSFDFQAFCKPLSSTTLTGSDSAALRTIDVDIYNRSDDYQSVAKGQYLYSIKEFSILTPFTPPQTNADVSYSLYRCTVEDVDYIAGEVTLGEFKEYDDGSGLWSDSPSFVIDISDSPFLSNIILAVYSSDEFGFGFNFKGYTTYGRDEVTALTANFFSTLGASSLTAITYNPKLLYISEDFEDIYDEDTVKQVAPKGVQIIDYLGAMLIVDHEALYFSDFSVGGNIETYTPFDSFGVGSTKRGRITGVFANETFICVLREEEAYYITGNIFLANYRIQSYKSTRIGCTDPKSIIDFRGAGIFLSKKGIYMCQQGGAMPEMSDQIETIFSEGALDLGLDLTDCSSVVDFRRELILFNISGTIVVYQYYFNEWFLWDDFYGSGAFDILDGKFITSDGTDIYREVDTNIDAAAYYVGNFNTLGRPSLEKKFTKATVFTIDMPEASPIAIKTYKNWNTEEPVTDESKSVSAGEVDLSQRFNMTRSKSMAIEIRSDEGNTLNLNGYEYEVSADVRSTRDDG